MKKLICIILFMSLPCVVCAAPSISSYSGSPMHQQTLTIHGSDFGVKSPAAPIRYDNFEGGTVGQIIDSEDSGGWFTDGLKPIYSASKTRYAGTQSAYQNYYDSNNYNSTLGLKGSLNSISRIYVSGWKHMETFGAPSRNVKLINMGLNYGVAGWQTRIDWYPVNGSGHMYVNAGCDGAASHIGSWGTNTSTMMKDDGDWHRIDSWFDLGTPNGGDGYRDVYVDLEKITEISGTFIDGDCSSIGYMYAGFYYSTTSFAESSNPAEGGSCSYVDGAIIKNSVDGKYYTCNDGVYSAGGGYPAPELIPRAKRYWDELYVDITRARVEIGNASTWEDCTHREIQIPTAWSTTSATITFNQGSFNLNDTAYLFVVDADGTISNGYQIEIDGTDISPPAITNLLPTNGSSSEAASQTLSAIINDSSGVANVRYSTSDISYASMGSGGDMSQSGSTWTKGVTLSLGSNTYYIAAIDTLDNATTSNASTTVTLTEGGDTTAPEVTAFVIPTGSSSLTFPVTTFTATDAVGVTGYLITESATPPSAGDVGWSASVPSSYTAESDGAHTLYAWAKDAGSNISDSLNDSVTITISSLPGGVTDFSPTGDTSLNVNTTNYSTDTNLKVYSWPSNEPSNTAILVFDTSAYSAQGVIHSATLKLFVEESGGDAAMNVAVARLNVDPVVAQATGEVYAAGSDWTSPSPRQTAPFSELGLMNIAAPSDIVSIEAALGQYKNFDVTSIVQKAVAENDPTFAILVYPHGDMSSDTYRFFSSQDHATAEQRPVLTVTFQHAGGNSASGGEVR